MVPRRAVAWFLGCAVICLLAFAALAPSGRRGSADVGTGGATEGRPETTANAGGTTSSTAPRSATTAAPTTTTTEAPATGPADPADPDLGNGETVTIAFGGDVHFEGIVRQGLDAQGRDLLTAIAPVLSGSDLAVVNLETAITERGVAATKAYTFRAPGRALDALVAAGVDVASMANNHGLDYGPDGLTDSLAAETAQGLPLIGIGANATQAYEPQTFDVRGQRIAVIAATQVLDDALIGRWTATDTQAGVASAKEVGRLVGAVVAARAEADTVVVFLHWGTEKQTCPQDRQTTLARQLVDAGADIVIGGHAHRLQGAGRLGSAFVGYGLGNFVFYTQGGPGAETGVVTVSVTGRRIDGYTFTPARLRSGLPVPLGGDEATAATAAWQALRGCTDLTE